MKNIKISSMTVERDGNGYWSHPAYIIWFDNFCMSTTSFEFWAESCGMEVAFVYLEEDVDFCSQAGKRWFKIGYSDISEWEPSEPAGEGWFIVSIHNTGDGPTCIWMREIK